MFRFDFELKCLCERFIVRWQASISYFFLRNGSMALAAGSGAFYAMRCFLIAVFSRAIPAETVTEVNDNIRKRNGNFSPSSCGEAHRDRTQHGWVAPEVPDVGAGAAARPFMRSLLTLDLWHFNAAAMHESRLYNGSSYALLGRILRKSSLLFWDYYG